MKTTSEAFTQAQGLYNVSMAIHTEYGYVHQTVENVTLPVAVSLVRNAPFISRAYRADDPFGGIRAHRGKLSHSPNMHLRPLDFEAIAKYRAYWNEHADSHGGEGAERGRIAWHNPRYEDRNKETIKRTKARHARRHACAG